MSWTQILERPQLLRLSAALLHFLWQGAAVAALFGISDAILRRRAAAAKAHYALACAALAVMAILPVATFAGIGGADRALASTPDLGILATAGTSASAAPVPASEPVASALDALARGARHGAAEATPALVGIWMAGVLILSIRLLAGWRLADRLIRRGTRPARAELAALFSRLARRLALTRPVRFLESAAIEVPTALGILRPVVLVPVSAITGLGPLQLEALLAHELAHVRRHDYLVNLLQSAVETLLFYHPAIWWVSGRIRRERENCCDDLAVAVSGDARTYAGALVELEAQRGARRSALALGPGLGLGADGGELFHRIARLITPTPREGAGHASRLAGAIALGSLLLIGAAARVSSIETSSILPVEVLPEPAASPDPPEPPRDPAPALRAAAARESVRAVPAVAALASLRAAKSASAAPAAPSAPTEPARGAAAATSPTEATTPEAATNPSALSAPSSPGEPAAPATLDDSRAMRIHGVTPEFREQIAALGYRSASADDLVSLRIHGVEPSDIAALQKIFGRLSLERCVEFSIHGVSPAWLASIAAAGLPRISPDEAVALRIHGVTPEFLKLFRQSGFTDISADEAVSLRIHGVRPEDAAAWDAAGLGRPSLDELVSARIHGVEAAFARAMKAEGLSAASPSLDELVSLKIHGVSPEYVHEMRAAGLPISSADDATTLRIHGVTPGYLQELKSLGLAVTSADDATSLKIHGVTAADLREFRGLGYRDLSADELVDLRIHGVTPDEARRLNREAGKRLSVDELVDVRIEGAAATERRRKP